MKRKLLIFLSCFLIIFVTVVKEDSKPIYATDLTWDVVTDPKKLFAFLIAAGITLNTLTTDAATDLAESVYNGLTDSGKTAVKVAVVTGSLITVAKDNFSDFLYDMYNTLNLAQLINNVDQFFNPSTNSFTDDRRGLSLLGIGTSTTLAWSLNSTKQAWIEEAQTSFTTSNGTANMKIAYWQFTSTYVAGSISASPTTEVRISTNWNVNEIYVYPTAVPLNTFTAWCSENTSVCAVNGTRDVLVQRFDFSPTYWTVTPTNSKDIIFSNYAYSLLTNNYLPFYVDSITSSYTNTNLLPITLDYPVNPSYLDPAQTWPNTTVGDIDLNPDWTYDGDDVIFGGGALDLPDLTHDAVVNPILDVPTGETITNPILDVLIHLPAYIDAAADAVNDFANGLVDAAAGALGATIGAVTGWIGNIVKSIENILASIFAYLGSMLTDIVSALAALGVYIVNGITSFFTTFMDFVTDFLNFFKNILQFFLQLFRTLWNFFVDLLMLIYQTLILGVFAGLSAFILNLKSLMAILPNPFDSISYIMIDISVFVTMLGVVLKVLSMRKGS